MPDLEAGYNLIRFAVVRMGAHQRGAGAEDLLQWTDAQWEKQHAVRSKTNG